MRPWEPTAPLAPYRSIPIGDGWWRTSIALHEFKQILPALGPIGLHDPVQLPDQSVAVRPNAEFLRVARTHEAEQAALALGHDSLEACAPLSVLLRSLTAAIAAHGAKTPAPVWMAILNLTPDSFSDGGQLDSQDALLQSAHVAREQGAAWLDLGAESTRPGAQAISDQAQLARLLPAIELLLPLSVPLSIDTRSAAVAEACLQAGASMINDVSGLGDPAMAACCAKHEASLTLMHMRGTPAEMQDHCSYRFLLGEVADELSLAAERAIEAGVMPERLLLDPGIGFAKTAEQSRSLLAQVGSLRALGCELLVGPSRKSFQSELIPERSSAERDCGTAGAAASCILQGVGTLRLHSGAFWDAARVAAGIASAPQASPLHAAAGVLPLG